MSLQTKVYQKENNQKLATLLKESLADIYHSRFLARQLASRDIRAQYRQSYFGILWAFVGPLATAMIWIFLNNTGTIKVTDTGIPYPVFVFSGTLLWSIIIASINAPASATNSAKSILSKINFPKEALIVSGIYKMLFDTVIKIFLLLVFVFAFGVGFHWSLLWLPVLLFGAIFFGTTIGLFITPLGMLYTDVSKFISFGFRFLMYATPVVYAIPKEGVLKMLMEINPLTPIILTTREAIVGMPITYLNYYLILMAVCVPLFCLALVFYRLSIPIIVERSNA
jgi:lipopolysaccharide transport system permease protein